jgi:sn-glycerol 3-phosphate transport system ATP-binding protein
MNLGRADQIGTPQDVYNRPATTYVGGFIGSPAMNFVDCRIEGGAIVLPDGTRLAAPASWSVPAGDYRLGLRPEHIRLSATGETPHLELQVDVAEELGADTLLHGKIAGAEIVARIPSNAGFHDRSRPGIIIDTTQSHLFDRENGLRIAI